MTAADFAGTLVEGTFKSFSAKKGWGFLNCSHFQEDIFVSFKTAPVIKDALAINERLQGLSATFLISESKTKPGTFEAIDVTIINMSGSDADAAQYAAEVAGLGAGASQLFAGRGAGGGPHRSRGSIKSFNAQKGWGFIICPDVEGDIFVSLKTSPSLETGLQQFGDLMGQPVTFSLMENDRKPGTFEARDVAFNSGGRSGKGGSGKFAGGSPAQGFAKGWNNAMWNGGAGMMHHMMGGKGPSMYDGGKSFAETALAYGKAASYGQVPNYAKPPGCYGQAPTAFSGGQTPVRSSSAPYGQKAAAYSRSPAPSRAPQEEGQWFEGVFKSFSEKSGWGFLNSPNVDGDIFVSFKTAPNLQEAVRQLGRLDGQSATFMLQQSKNRGDQWEAINVTVEAFGGGGYGPSKGGFIQRSAGPYGKASASPKGYMKGGKF